MSRPPRRRPLESCPTPTARTHPTPNSDHQVTPCSIPYPNPTTNTDVYPITILNSRAQSGPTADELARDYIFQMWLARCLVMNGKARSAWEIYLKIEGTQVWTHATPLQRHSLAKARLDASACFLVWPRVLNPLATAIRGWRSCCAAYAVSMRNAVLSDLSFLHDDARADSREGKERPTWCTHVQIAPPQQSTLPFNRRLLLPLVAAQESFAMLQLLANDCYRAGAFLYSAKAFETLERLDPNPEYWEGKRGACIGVFQQVIANKERHDVLRDVRSRPTRTKHRDPPLLPMCLMSFLTSPAALPQLVC
eukprot:6196092-Pleurochrysis_carterae.AAC.2